MECQDNFDNRCSKKARSESPKPPKCNQQDDSDVSCRLNIPSNVDENSEIFENLEEKKSPSAGAEFFSFKRKRDDLDERSFCKPRSVDVGNNFKAFQAQNEVLDIPSEEQNLILDKLKQVSIQSEVASLVDENQQKQKRQLLKSNLEDTRDSLLVPQKDNNSFRFFWWDAFDDSTTTPGTILLFGKTYQEIQKTYSTCCVAVRNIERKVYFLPRLTQQDGEKTITTNDVYEEVKDCVMKKLDIKNFKATIVTKKYAFEPEVPVECDYVEVRYPATDSPISADTSGRTFSRVFGANTSLLEILLLDRGIKGPCWLDVSNPESVTAPASWCSVEINCNVGDLSIVKQIFSQPSLSPPPLVVLAITSRTVTNPENKTKELVLVAGTVYRNYSVDEEASEAVLQKKFCGFTSPSWQSRFPENLTNEIKKYDTLQKFTTEKLLLTFFVTQVDILDPDVIVGHDLQGDFIGLISDRLVLHKIGVFSQLGRIRRQTLVKQKLYFELFSGRLICDIKYSAKELIQCRSYEMQGLCQAVLNIPDAINYEPDEILVMFNEAASLCKLASETLQTALYIFSIMCKLNIVPFALHTTNIAGNIMSKNLFGGRYRRNEFLLLHAFTERNYIVPDKQPYKPLKTNRAPTHTGGLVLEPKVGFYNTYILVLDFNSLYPSIMQEYNICFTTKPPTLSFDNMVVPDSDTPVGVLPEEVRKLVESRRQIINVLQSTELPKDVKFRYNTKQMALKLTANSIYGCLGFANSRFGSTNLAALITFKGREILCHTRDLVTEMGLEVIYGDTDSIMIHTKSVNYDEVVRMGSTIKEAVNKTYKKVELDIDSVFKCLLLLQKKKYAAVTLSKSRDGSLVEEQIYKGIEIVQRDWSALASNAGEFILKQIFSDEKFERRVENILEYLRKIKRDLDAERIPLSELVISKRLTKHFNSYHDKNAFPHVQVALRYNKEYGRHFKVGDEVPYVICRDGTDQTPNNRAYHLAEVEKKANLKVDIDYYLSKQVYPLASRICAPIKEIDDVQLADILLGVKPKETTATAEPIDFGCASNFSFACSHCGFINEVDGPLRNGIPVLVECQNTSCTARPVDYISDVLDQMEKQVDLCFSKCYEEDFYCTDKQCDRKYERCDKKASLKDYTTVDLSRQLKYFHHIFDLSQLPKSKTLSSASVPIEIVDKSKANAGIHFDLWITFLDQCGICLLLLYSYLLFIWVSISQFVIFRFVLEPFIDPEVEKAYAFMQARTRADLLESLFTNQVVSLHTLFPADTALNSGVDNTLFLNFD